MKVIPAVVIGGGAIALLHFSGVLKVVSDPMAKMYNEFLAKPLGNFYEEKIAEPLGNVAKTPGVTSGLLKVVSDMEPSPTKTALLGGAASMVEPEVLKKAATTSAVQIAISNPDAVKQALVPDVIAKPLGDAYEGLSKTLGDTFGGLKFW